MVIAVGYSTKQSRLIENVLKNNSNIHLTADEIFEKLKSNGEAVGKTTVYRHLEKLYSDGIVRKFSGGDGGSACFQYTHNSSVCKSHYHLNCVECGELIHAECEFLNKLSEHILSEHGFSVDGSKTVLYGICEDCAKKRKALTNDY